MIDKIKLLYDFNDNHVNLKVFFNKTSQTGFLIEIKNFYSGVIIHNTKTGPISLDYTIDKNFHFYFFISNAENKVQINVYENENLILTEKLQIQDNYGNLIKQPTVLLHCSHLGMGDVLWANPSIKKLSKSFNRRIDVITRYPELLINNPYVNNVYKINPFQTAINTIYDKFKALENPNFFEIFPDHKNECTHISQLGYPNYITNHLCIDLREYAAMNCGFNLLPDEKNVDFFPNDFVNFDLPEKYVLINPRIAGVDRDIGKEKWQRLIDILNDNNINVVTIGVKNKDGIAEYHDVKVKLGKNLCGLECQNNLSQTWHIINKSNCFITFDTGIYILAGTTDAQIFLIGWYADPHWHKPFRNNSYDYKLKVIEGDCKEKCISNLKHYINTNGYIRQRRVQTCALNFTEYKCIPSVEKIANEVIKYYENI
jgi:ADP-heptose:LPS heptosyltransferase